MGRHWGQQAADDENACREFNIHGLSFVEQVGRYA
jgi:hypothetical protein